MIEVTITDMKVGRNFSVVMQYVLDELVPPRLRDSAWFMTLPMKLVLKEGTGDFMTFKEWFYQADSRQISELYRRTAHLQELQGETDLNARCTNRILGTLSGGDVLEVGCGRGYLANLISKTHRVVACDIAIPTSVRQRYPSLVFVEGNIEDLPFNDNAFDSVVCTHTLEHTQDLRTAVDELRRVARKELIIVVPRQRPYRYTFSLHTQFFPYRWSIHNGFGYRPDSTLDKLGDWFYSEKNPIPGQLPSQNEVGC